MSKTKEKVSKKAQNEQPNANAELEKHKLNKENKDENNVATEKPTENGHNEPENTSQTANDL